MTYVTRRSRSRGCRLARVRRRSPHLDRWLGQRQDHAAASGPPPYAVRLEVLEFSQVFRTPDTSVAIVSVRASLVERGRGVVLNERAFSVEREAASANAQGAVGALQAASEAMLAEVFAWTEVQVADTAGTPERLRLTAARAKIP